MWLTPGDSAAREVEEGVLFKNERRVTSLAGWHGWRYSSPIIGQAGNPGRAIFADKMVFIIWCRRMGILISAAQL